MYMNLLFWIVAAVVALAATVFLWLAFVAWAYAKDKRTLLAEELEDNGSEQG